MLPLMPRVVMMGLGATLLIDLWALLLRRAFGVRSLDFCLLGRWVLHMPRTFRHANIAHSPRRPHECAAGWTLHYSIGVGFALLFAVMAGTAWFVRPAPLPALLFGAATVVVPLFTLQPAFGLGVAASRTAEPWKARLKSLLTHVVFGAGLYLGARLDM